MPASGSNAAIVIAQKTARIRPVDILASSLVGTIDAVAAMLPLPVAGVIMPLDNLRNRSVEMPAALPTAAI
jgi:hypothetical protein